MLPDFRTPMLWALCFGLAAALLTAGVERTRAAGARADLAAEKAERARENTARAVAALTDLQRVVAVMVNHAKTQQENVNAYEARLRALDERRAAVVAERDRVRKQYADYVASDRDHAGNDTVACQRLADRSAVLAAMAARSRELLERGRLVVEGRDSEVHILLSTVKNDRALLVP